MTLSTNGRRIGRQTSLTPEVQDAVVKAIRRGCTVDDAAILSGVSDTTLYNWKQRGEKGEEPYAAFLEAVTRAKAAAKAHSLREVRRGVMMNGDKDWKARAWWLERMFPQEFGPQAAVHVKVEKELGAALDRLKDSLAPDVYHLVLNALAGEAGGSQAPAGEEGGGEGSEGA